MIEKIGLLFRQASENRIKNNLKEANSAFIIKYSGLSSPDITQLRQRLKNSSSKFFVVKNSVARRALKDSGLDAIIASIEGPCGFVFANDEDPVNASKILYNFSKEHANLKVEAGFMKEKILTRKDIEVLASLPSKEVLRGKTVVILNAPISGFVCVLNQVLRKFVYCLDQIKKKKENGG